jgi:hypothetical protein
MSSGRVRIRRSLMVDAVAVLRERRVVECGSS